VLVRNERCAKIMNNINREDIYELNELEKIIDTDSISYRKLMGVL
jgi:hypothetical protein